MAAVYPQSTRASQKLHACGLRVYYLGMVNLEQLNTSAVYLSIRYKVGYLGRGGTRHLLVSYSGGERGTFRPDCNGNVDYRRVQTTGCDTDRVSCQRCIKSLRSF